MRAATKLKSLMAIDQPYTASDLKRLRNEDAKAHGTTYISTGKGYMNELLRDDEDIQILPGPMFVRIR